jgi:poly-beta-1,6-N-acetyl-D-glucosamine synthase
MKWVFWSAVAFISYSYFGYPAWLWLRSQWHSRPIFSGPNPVRVSIVMVVRDEAGVLERKLKNLLGLDYPAELTEIIVVSDGSTDATASILSTFARVKHLRTIISDEGHGKASGLNEAITAATGEVVVFTDARQYIEEEALGFLVEDFADPAVGCASGQLMLGDPATGETTQGIGLYWKIEKRVRELESLSGSVVGATGALYAVSRSLLVPLPPDTILDDVYLPMQVLRQGKRVIFEPRAKAWDIPHQGHEKEFARKVRTLSGNYQLLRLAPWLLGPSNPAWIGFFSHKVSRLIVPLALGALLVSSIFAAGEVYHFALGLQLAFYALAAWSLVGPKQGFVSRAADAAFNFLLLNTAAFVALANFVLRRRAAWT